MGKWVIALILVGACQSGDVTDDSGGGPSPPPVTVDGGQVVTIDARPDSTPLAVDAAVADAGLVAWTPATLPRIFDVTWLCVKDCTCPPDGLLDVRGIDYLRSDCPPALRFSNSETSCPSVDKYYFTQESPFTWSLPEFGGVNDCPEGPEPFGLRKAQATQIDNETLVGEITQYGYTRCKKNLDAAHSCQPTMQFIARVP